MAAGVFVPSIRLSDQELESMFFGSDIPAKIVELLPKEAFRCGYVLKGKDASAASALQKKAKLLGFDTKARQAWTFGRLYGGALLVIGADDGEADLSLPMVEARVRGIRYLNVVDRRFAHVVKYQENPLLPGYGEADVYSISGASGGVSYIHASRCIRFDGTEIDAFTRRQLCGWTYSVLQRPYDTIRQFETGFASAGHLLADASLGVWKIQGLIDMIAADEGGLQERLRLADMTKSSGRSIAVDAELEEFTRVATSFAGLDAMLDRFMMRLASAADMPVTKLMGRSAAGMNATGEGDEKNWIATVASGQADIAVPAMERFYRILSAGKLADPEIEFNAISEPSEKEKVDTKKVQADTDKLYVDMGALQPEQVAMARFGTGNGEIEIDEEALKKSLAQEIEISKNPPPPPVPPMPPKPGAVPPTPEPEEDDPDAPKKEDQPSPVPG